MAVDEEVIHRRMPFAILSIAAMNLIIVSVILNVNVIVNTYALQLIIIYTHWKLSELECWLL